MSAQPVRRPAARTWLEAVLTQRCPRCRDGRVFKGTFAMNELCPVCGLIFEREPGYFLGAMYFSFGMATGILVVFYFLLRWLLPEWRGEWLALISVLPYLPLMPLVFRYSRVLWLYFDRTCAPTEVSSPESWTQWKQQRQEEPPGS